MELPEKRQVLDALIESMSETVHQLAQTAEQVRQDAIHAEAKPENDKDTRALEQSYLARGQAIRVESLVEQLQVLRTLPLLRLGPDDPIRAGTLIGLEDDEGARCVFLAPHGGGISLQVGEVAVTVVTPTSALGRALLGRLLGDDVEVRTRDSARSYTITAVA